MSPGNKRSESRAQSGDSRKWASWKQLNRLARTTCELLELDYAPDPQTVSALIDRLDNARQSQPATSTAAPF